MVQQTKNRFSSRGGQIVIELLVAFGLAGILLPALLTGLVGARSGKVQQQERVRAIGLLKEAEEATRSVREANWANIATNGTYYPKAAGGAWTLINIPDGTYEPIGDFKWNIVISDLAQPDPSLKQVDITVSWGDCPGSCITSTLYLTRWRNTAYSPIAASGTLSGIGHGDWCNPNLHIIPYDISGNGIGIAISSVPGAASGEPDGAFITTGNNASSYSLYSVSITDPPYPTVPVATTANTYNNGKDYGLFATEDYVYAATGNVPGDPKRVVDILNLDLTPAGFFDASSNLIAQSVAVEGNVGYVTASTSNGSSSYLIAFSASPVNGGSSQSQIWSKNLTNNAVGNKVVVNAGYAFIATAATSNSQQLQVMRLSDQAIFSPPSSGTGSIGTNQPGIDIAVLGDYAYLITGYSSSSPDIFVIDVSDPTSPTVVGSATTLYNGSVMSPLGVATTPNNANKLIVVGDGGWQYQSFDVEDPANPVRCGTPLQDPNGAAKVQAVSTLREEDGDVYSYILTTTGSTQQFQIIEGGEGGAGGNGGTFESAIFDCRDVVPACTSPVIFNSFRELTDPAAVPPIPSPSGVTTSYSVAVSADPNCNDPSFAYGYTGSYGPSGGQIPLSLNPGYCFRYEVTFSGAAGAGSASTKVSVNYSP